MSLQGALSEPAASQFEHLQQIKESLGQCIRVVSEAGELDLERSNVFEDPTLADNNHAFSVSTVNDLVTVRPLGLSGQSRQVAGKVREETTHKSLQMFSLSDNGDSKLWRDVESHLNAPPIEVSATTIGFEKRKKD